MAGWDGRTTPIAEGLMWQDLQEDERVCKYSFLEIGSQRALEEGYGSAMLDRVLDRGIRS